MKVTIKTTFGKMKFEMDQHHAVLLIRNAAEFATKSEEAAAVKPAPVPAIPTTPPTAKPSEASVEKKRPATPKTTANIPAPTQGKRSESLFGAKETWDMPAADNKPAQSETGEREEYWGALFVKCESCGKTKVFFTKNHVTYQMCECGHKTELYDLMPAFFKCKCGKEIKYRTNMDSMKFDIPCPDCGNPVDLELNGRSTAFVTILTEES